MTAITTFTIGKRANGGSLRRFVAPKPKGGRSGARAGGGGLTLAPEHPALTEMRTLFPTRVVHASVADRLLKSGEHSSKIGKRITKGAWAGFPVFTLTLEERRTCPTTCQRLADCFGNNMHMAHRHIVDEVFAEKLGGELEALEEAHPRGFVVRLHVLGDFPSLDYVRMWAWALAEFPALRVFGYTAHAPDSEIGAELLGLASNQWPRFAMRFSGLAKPELGAVVIAPDEATEFIVCPAQRGLTDCCATCALCWQTKKTIAFLKH